MSIWDWNITNLALLHFSTTEFRNCPVLLQKALADGSSRHWELMSTWDQNTTILALLHLSTTRVRKMRAIVPEGVSRRKQSLLKLYVYLTIWGWSITNLALFQLSAAGLRTLCAIVAEGVRRWEWLPLWLLHVSIRLECHLSRTFPHLDYRIEKLARYCCRSITRRCSKPLSVQGWGITNLALTHLPTICRIEKPALFLQTALADENSRRWDFMPIQLY